jgi:predicted branched-subunit amino acid permease
MLFSVSFREGARAAVPVWIAFTTSSFALGVAAKAHGLDWGEITLMSALVYAGPAQFAVLEAFGAGKPALQILFATLLLNLRFLPMSATLAPYFGGVGRLKLYFASHFISASSFVVPYFHFQRQEEESGPGETTVAKAESNLAFFLGVGLTSFTVWVAGTAVGYWAALHVPARFEEGMKFILPGYFACLLASEIKGRMAALVCAASLLLAVPGALWNPDWGWIVTAGVVATACWGMEEWTRRA